MMAGAARARGGSRGIIFVLLVLLVAGCRTGQQQWGPFRGRVVDADTGRPITPAYAIVSWHRASTMPFLHTTDVFYDAREAVTDANGQFEIPRLGRFVTMLVGEPAIGVWAPGYLTEEPEVTPASGRPYVDPTVVKMRPLKTRQERCRYLPSAAGAPTSKRPRFADAVHAYVAELDCRAEERQP